MSTVPLILLGTLSCAVSISALSILLPRAERFGFIAQPDPTVSNHVRAVPLLGGVGIVAGVMACLPLATAPVRVTPPWLAGMAILFALGAYKDRVGRPVRSGLQLLVQASAIWLGTEAMDLPTICGTTWVNRALLCVFGLWLVNSVNFLDVMDGLAGGVMLMIAAASAVVLQRSGDGGASALATGVVGAIAGFLLFNWHPARIFMGDVGSFSLGYLLFTLVLAADREAGHATAFALAAVPMLEVASSSMLRIAKSTSPLRGDGTHVALMLLDRGIRVPFIVLAFLAVTVSCACAAVMLAGPD